MAAAVAVCLLTMLGMAVSTLLIAREKARTEQSYVLAEEQFREARDAVDTLGTRVAEELAGVPGAAEVRETLLPGKRYGITPASQDRDQAEPGVPRRFGPRL